jgi:hypothetical protein
VLEARRRASQCAGLVLMLGRRVSTAKPWRNTCSSDFANPPGEWDDAPEERRELWGRHADDAAAVGGQMQR